MDGEPRTSTLVASKIRWQCRRGMLELDLVLEQFLENGYSGLDEEQQGTLLELLGLPDTDLWDLILGRTESDNMRFRPILALLRTNGINDTPPASRGAGEQR